nr:PREDICTED: cell growth regulator with RING finger domain protein 1 isoform X2 [Lepisosteus oculatus]
MPNDFVVMVQHSSGVFTAFDMAAVFLVMLYEYSPLFYISVVSLCFVITAAMVLGWFSFDVPVILRSSDDTDSIPNIPEKRMVEVKNPFALEIDSTASSVTGGVSLKPRCLENCVLSCYWGCTVQGLEAALQTHQLSQRINTPQRFEEALRSDYQHSQTFLYPTPKQLFVLNYKLSIDKEDTEERHCQLPADLGIADFGQLPRSRYPLLALLTLAEPETRQLYEIVANLTVIHIPDEKYRLSSRILYQYILTAQGHMYDLKLFMSADGRDWSRETEPGPSGEEGEQGEEAERGVARDCVVCQCAPVNRVLLPCRHACVCDACVARFRHCPMCRTFVLESFALSPRLATGQREGAVAGPGLLADGHSLQDDGGAASAVSA